MEKCDEPTSSARAREKEPATGLISISVRGYFMWYSLISSTCFTRSVLLSVLNSRMSSFTFWLGIRHTRSKLAMKRTKMS